MSIIESSTTKMEVDNGEEDIVDDLFYAARTGDEEWLVEILASHPALVTNTDSNGNTPLHLSSANGHNEIIKRILKYPQSISPQNNAGNTPLHWACLNNHVDTAKLLLQEGADMFIKNAMGRDAVWEAEQRGNEELVGWMLAFGEEREVGEVIEQEAEETEDIPLENAETKEVVNGSDLVKEM